MKLLHLALAVLLAYRADGCRTPIDCVNAMLLDGVSVMDCPSANLGSPKNPIERIQLECCAEVTYTGPASQHYEFATGCPVVVNVLEVDLDVGESIIIRNIHCTSDPDECQMYIIDGSDSVPFNLEMSSSRFSLFASRDTVNIKYRVLGPDCDCTSKCDDGWTKNGGNCYKVSNQQRPWGWHQENCASKGGSIAFGYDQETYDVISEITPDFAWSGLHRIDPSNTYWFWETTHGRALNMIDNVWKTGYPVSSINDLCAYYPFNANGQLENGNCDVQRKALCVKPLT